MMVELNLAPEWLIPAPPDASVLTPEAAAVAAGEALHPQVQAFLVATAGAQEIRGGLSLRGASGLSAAGLPLAAWRERFGDDFPALCIGNDGYGHELWVHVGSARVLSVHHDSLEESLADVQLPTVRTEAVERVLAGRAGLMLSELLVLHRALGEAGPSEISQFHAICTALGWSVAQAVRNLESLWAAFLWVRVRDLLEGGEGTGELQAVRDVLTALSDNPASLSRRRALELSRAGLRRLPAGLSSLGGLQRLDLRGNPDLEPAALAELAALPRLRELSLAGCRLRTVPAVVGTLSGLQRLDLSGNPLVALPDLSALRELRELDLRETGVDDAALVEAARSALPACVIHLARSVYPASLGRAAADPESARIIDLSVGHHAEDAVLIKALPSLQRFTGLEVLRLRNQRLLRVRDVLAAVRGMGLRELDLRGVVVDDVHPMPDLHTLPRLEVLRLSSWPQAATADVVRYAAEHPGLRVLEFSVPSGWDGVLPTSQVEELSLSNVGGPFADVLTTCRAPAIPRLRRLQLAGDKYQLGEDLTQLPLLEALTLTGAVGNLSVLSDCVGLGTLVLLDVEPSTPWPDLSKLTRLEQLAVHGIKPMLESLLVQLPRLESLRTLELELGQGRVSPEAIAAVWQARRLRALKLSWWGTLPEGLGALEDLEDLELVGVKIPHPRDLVLPRLRRFQGRFSDGGRGTEALEALLEATALELLTFRDSSLTAFPPTLARLQGLRALRLESGRDLVLDRQPDLWSALERVEVLELSGMTATQLPEGVLSLPLRELTLNKQESLHWPTVLRQLSQVPTLKELHICWSKVAAIPEEIGLLSSLEVLVVHQTRTAEISPAIAALRRLQRLQVTANPQLGAAGKMLRKRLPGCDIRVS